MFDIGWSELLLIAVVALVVLDPKDLPLIMRKIGAFTAKARQTVASFQTMLESAGLEEERKELQQELQNLHGVSMKGQAAVMQPLTVEKKPAEKLFINS
jgi:sec-independent protein translocase protein TatB